MAYFQHRDVYADDPFTLQVEPSEPFALGLIVKNVGAGSAHNFKITSGQPQIVDDQKGLLINFSIIGTKIGDQVIRPSLTVNDARAEVALQAVAFDLLEDESTRVISIRRTLRRDQSEPNRTGLAIDKIGIDLVVVEGW